MENKGYLLENQTMEQIINNLKNPFDFEGFIKLLNIYANSADWYNFYGKVVTKNQDRPMQNKSRRMNALNKYMTEKGMEPWTVCEFFSELFPTGHRIYINSSLYASSKITELFILECEKNNIPFEIKYAIKEAGRSDGIVIGGNSSVFKKQIDILRKIAKEHPELIKECGKPHILTGELDGWMGIADENIDNRYCSYTQSRLGLIKSACIKFILKHNYQIKGLDYDMLRNEQKMATESVEYSIKSRKNFRRRKRILHI